VSLVTRKLGVDYRAYQHSCPREGVHRLRQGSLPSLQKCLRWYNELRKGLVGDGAGLDERGKDLSVLSEVGEESITAPPPHDLHSFYGQAGKQVEECSADTYAMSLQWLQVGLLGGQRQALDERGLGEGTKPPLVLVCEEVGI